MVAVAAVLMWLTSTPLVSGRLVQIAEGWRDRLPIDAIAHGDAVLVLSGGYREVPGESGASEFDDFDRALAGYDLYRASKAPRIMDTGGWSALRPELETVGAVLRERRFPLEFLTATSSSSAVRRIPRERHAQCASISPPIP